MIAIFFFFLNLVDHYRMTVNSVSIVDRYSISISFEFVSSYTSGAWVGERRGKAKLRFF